MEKIKMKYSERTRKKYNVSKSLWNKFGEEGRIMYHNMRILSQNIKLISPASRLNQREWDVISHNMSCFAAFEIKELMKIWKK